MSGVGAERACTLWAVLGTLLISASLMACGGVSDGSGGGVGPGLQVNPGTVIFDENGGPGSLSVALNTAPNEMVLADVLSTDETEVMVLTKQIAFTPDNWFKPQVVQLSGMDDDEIDGNQVVKIDISVNPTSTRDTTGYSKAGIVSHEVTVLDNDAVGVTVTPTSLTCFENGETATFSLRLNTIPTGEVVLAIASSDTSEAVVGNSALTFTAANWSQIQTVTVTGVDDNLMDGDQTFPILVDVDATASTDTTGYAAILPENVKDVMVTVADDDRPGVSVTPLSLPPFWEADGSGSFQVRLNAIPSDLVVIDLISSDATEAAVDKSSLTFTPENWDLPQQVTVRGVADGIADGDQTATIVLTVNTSATRDTTGYATPTPVSIDGVAVTVRDHKAGVTVSPGTKEFSENGGIGSFLVKLDSQPDQEVVIDISSSDPTEARVEKSLLIFYNDTWSATQTVLIRGVDDDLADGNQTVPIVVNVNKTLTKDTTGYRDLDDTAVTDIIVTVVDDD